MTAAALLIVISGCATAPPAKPVEPSFEEKLTWMLQLEDQRILRVPPPALPVTPEQPSGRRRPAVAAPKVPDLTVLIKDADPRIRRRAALAIGRTRLPEGIAPLSAALADTDPEVRSMAAFGLGLIGDVSAREALVPLLADPEPLVRGRAAEALGQIGARETADAISRMVAEYAATPAVTGMAPDDETWPAAPEAEAFKLGLFALVRLDSYDAIASAVLRDGRPVTTWWPVAYALQRVGDDRAAPPLMALLETPGRYTRAFAARGLGELKHTPAAQPLLRLLDPSADTPLEPVIAALRALGQIGAAEAAPTLARLAAEPNAHPNVRLECVSALGQIGSREGLGLVQDLITHSWPAMRAAALRAAAAIDPEGFVFVLSGLERDPDWRVRAALADVLGTLPRNVVLERTLSMLEDEDKRVIPAVLRALVRLKAPNIERVLLDRLADPDFVVRAEAARLVGEVKPAGGVEALRKAYEAAQPDSAYAARAAALEALAQFGAAEASDTLRAALSDKEWAIRVRAADLLRELKVDGAFSDEIRPVPGPPVIPYDDPRLISPPYSPHAFIETSRGTIEIELAVLDAPQTTHNFMTLARKGYFNGLAVHRVVANFVVQDGDPRGDGQGGPGYTIRDELNERPYLRGTVGMALSWRDTGGSQFFIAHSPQPHLDARYTAFGHVVDGMDVVDRIQQGDVIEQVRIWDGETWQ